jgi:predicted regulator of Ras-like GTPase activity (Roadblock/LC7/MglB family)
MSARIQHSPLSAPARGELDFLLDNFLRRVPHVEHIVAVSGDGLLVAADTGLTRDAADRLSATCAALLALLRVAGDELGVGGLSHNMAEYDEGFVFAMSTDSACLLMLADRECDLGQVSFELTDLVNRVGDALTMHPRTDY